MVFSRLFGRSDSDASSGAASADSSVPLTALPDDVLESYPALKLTPYDASLGNVCSNAVAVAHNAVRVETADMYGDILPSLRSRADECTIDDATALSKWWAGYARFALTTSIVDELVVELALSDIIADFDKDATRIARAARKFREKNTSSLEMAMRRMGRAVELFGSARDAASLAALEACWAHTSGTLLDIYALVERILHDVDSWRHDEIATHRDLERTIAAVYLNRKRWGADDTKRGEMLVVLTRWMGSEELIRDWMAVNVPRRELRHAERWAEHYRSTRLAIVDAFHQRSAA